MSKPTEAQLPQVEQAARASAGTLGSRVASVAFGQMEGSFLKSSTAVLGAKANQELFGLTPDPIGARDVHSWMNGVIPEQVEAIIAVDHIARHDGVWRDPKLVDKYTTLRAALEVSAYLRPSHAQKIMEMMRVKNTYDTGELAISDVRADKASGAPHDGVRMLAELAADVSDTLPPLEVIALTKGHTPHQIDLAQRRIQKGIYEATALRAVALALGGTIFGAVTGNQICAPAAIASAGFTSLRGGDLRRLQELIGIQAPKKPTAWPELWKSQGIVEQFIHHLGFGQVRSKSGPFVQRDIDSDRDTNPITQSISTEFLNSLSQVNKISELFKMIQPLRERVSKACAEGKPLSDVLGLLLGIDLVRRATHSSLPPKDTDLNAVFGSYGEGLSTAVKNVHQDRKLMLGLPVMMRLAIALGPPSTNIFKTTGDTAVVSWGLTGFDRILVQEYMDRFNTNSFSAEASKYKGADRFPLFDAIVAQENPSHDIEDLGVIASFQKSGQGSNLLNKGMYVVDVDSAKPATDVSEFILADSTLQTELEKERRAISQIDPAEVARRDPSSSDNVFTAMMTLSALKYYRNRADILQQHFNATVENTAFFNQARTNLDVAATGIIKGVLDSFIGVRSSLVHLASSRSGDDLNRIKALSTFVEWANREYPKDLAEVFAEPLKTCLNQTGQSKTPDPWSIEFALFMGRIASEKGFDPVLQGIAQGHLATMLDDTLKTHLSPLGAQTTNVPEMVGGASSTLPILVANINTSIRTQRSRVFGSIAEYVNACMTGPTVTIAQQHAGDHSGVASYPGIEARRLQINPTLTILKKKLEGMRFARDKVTGGMSNENLHRYALLVEIDRILTQQVQPSSKR